MEHNNNKLIKKIHLIRHGETVDNVSETLQGQQPGRLTDHGIQQAKERGKIMNKYKIEEAWVSDLKRAHDTFLYIHEQMENKIPNIHLKQIVRERGMGEAEGWHNEIYRQKEREYKQIHGEDAEYVAKGAESQEVLNNRVKECIEELKHYILDQNGTKSLVIVSHGVFLRRLLKFIKEQALGHELMLDHEKYSNVELVEFDAYVDPNNRQLEILSWKKERLPGQPEIQDRAQM